MSRKVLYLSLFILLISSFCLSAQYFNKYGSFPEGTSYRDRLIDYADIVTYRIDPHTRDTLMYTRRINNFWFGIYGGPNLNLSFGALHSSLDPNNPKNIFNTITDFNSKLCYGYSFGIIGEWMRPTSDLSGGLKLTALDKKITKLNSDQIIVASQFANYDFNASLSYLVLSPYVKYSFPSFDGFFVDAGIDVAVNYKTTTYLDKQPDTAGKPHQIYYLEGVNGKTRFSFSLGTGYDFFIADFFATNSRVRITPFADFKFGTNIITDNGSNWNDVSLNLGLQVKLAPDVVKVDTLTYNPESDRPSEVYLAVNSEEGIEFTGLRRFANPPVMDLVYISDKVTPAVAVAIAPSLETEKPIVPETRRVSRTFRYNDTMTVGGFTTSTSSRLTDEMTFLLDELATFLKDNPSAIVRVFGHSDDKGTAAQNLTRSRNRASVARQYLIDKGGIQAGRIFFDGRSSLYPTTPNTTETNMRKNRRIQILIERGR